MHLNTPGFNAGSSSFGKDNSDNVAYTFGTKNMRSLQKYRGNAPTYLSPMHLNPKGGDVDIDVTSFEKVESEYDDNNSSNKLNYVVGNINYSSNSNSVYKENELPTFDNKNVNVDAKEKKYNTKIQSGIHGDVFSKYIQGINDKHEVSAYISYNNSSEDDDDDEQRSKSARIQSDEEVEDDELSSEANVNVNVNHFNESIIMAKQLVKALLSSKKYKANIDVIAHDYGIDMLYINNKLNQSRSMGVQTGKFNSMSLNSLRYSMGNYNNVYDFDYDLQVVDEVDEITEALCYLTIPRVVYFKKKLVVMMVCPMINRSNVNDYYMVFKHVSGMNKVFEVLMKDIIACYEKDNGDGCTKTFCVHYVNKKTFTKGVVDVTTKTKDECNKLVRCIQELINN